MTSRASFTRLSVLLTSVLMLAACATTPPPQDSLDAARLALQRAQQADALGAASVELRLARERLDEAVRAAAARENARALMLAEQSLVNSELALARAEEAQARLREAEAIAENARLRAELDDLIRGEEN